MGLSRPRRWQSVCMAGLLLAALLAGLFLLLRLVLVPLVVHRMITQQSELVEGSRMMNKWKDPQYKMQFKVWIYTVRNPDEILAGEKPQLRLEGPYVFDKKMHHEVLSSGNGTVSFKRHVLYHFNEEDSCQTCILGNRVWVPNIIYQKFVEVASRPTMKAAATALLAQSPFLEVEVGDLLFNGYKDPFLENFCDVPFVNVVCQTVFDMPERIGLFYGFNDSYSEGEYTIKDGTTDIRERADVIAFNGMPKLRTEWWSDEEARVLRGSEGTLFHPFIRTDEALWTFASQLCRSIRLLFSSEITYRGLPAYRFKVPPEEFDSTTAENAGFCHPNEKLFYSHQNETSNERHCYARGLMAVARCRRNEPPVVISLPHFYLAPPEVRDSVSGLNETDDDRDTIMVDVEPDLGIALKAQRRIQLNVEFWSGKEIVIPAYHQRQRSTLIPIAVVHDDAEMDEDSFRMVRDELHATRRLANSAVSLLGLLSLAVALCSLLYGLYSSGSLNACLPRSRAVFPSASRSSAASSLPALYEDEPKRPAVQIRPSNYI